MNDDVENEIKAIKEVVSALPLGDMQKHLGIDPKFINEVISEPSDWAFVIKLAVLVEAALAQTIAASIGNDVMQHHLMRLPIDGRIGKIQLAKDLGVIGVHGAARLRKIAAIRNDFAHDVSVINLSLVDYTNRMSEGDRNSIWKTLLTSPGKEVPDNSGTWDDNVVRCLYWVGACLCLTELGNAYHRKVADMQNQKIQMLVGAAYMAKSDADISVRKAKIKEARDYIESLNLSGGS